MSSENVDGPSPARRRRQLEQELGRSIHCQELSVHYQPIWNVKTGALSEVEALARWDRAGHESIPPEVFVPLAEESGFIPSLGRWMLHEAISQLRTWRRDRSVTAAVSVAVNVSPLQLLDASLPAAVTRLIDEAGLSCSDLTLELTETSLIVRDSEMAHNVDALSATGATISIDDVGAGSSTLDYLEYLPATQVKLDKSLVVNVARSQRDEALVGSLIRTAHDCGVSCVAEGVESAEVLTTLSALNCDLAQGFLKGRPAPAADVLGDWASNTRGF